MTRASTSGSGLHACRGRRPPMSYHLASSRYCKMQDRLHNDGVVAAGVSEVDNGKACEAQAIRSGHWLLQRRVSGSRLRVTRHGRDEI